MNRIPIKYPRKPVPDLKEPYGYVYITTNLINGRQYIGQHSGDSFDKRYHGSGTTLQKAMKKYGKQNFKTEVLEWAKTAENLNELEIYWISLFDAVNSERFYNITIGGEALGAGESHPCYGKPLSEERKHNLIAHNHNRVFSEETRKKISIANTGNSLSLEHKQKLIQSNLGNRKRAKTVYQFDMDGRYITSYFGLNEAARQNPGFNPVCIGYCCSGKQAQHKGYLWSYLPPVNNQINNNLYTRVY